MNRVSSHYVEDVGPVYPHKPGDAATVRQQIERFTDDEAIRAELLDITGIEPIDHGRPTNRGTWGEVRSS